ncbi:MAG: hypothetical protein F6K32_05925 [Desertifilum sp. SIO1I2]|nr:hypothetical protein [Desertifilum sp. SIO1I2]
MDALLERARTLKNALIQFVLEAEGELATALETFVAQRSQQKPFDINQRNLITDTFLTQGEVGEKTPIELFIASRSDLSGSDRDLLTSWHRSFIALFEVEEKLPDGFKLMNWLTSKHYLVKPNDPLTLEEMSRFQLGEILLCRIAPVTADYWMFSGPCITKGNLGKPKLAVVIGEFKQNYRASLYSDAPDLLEEAWESVATYHQAFVEHFGSDRITGSGYQINKQITELQEKMAKQRLEAAGIDSSKSLKEIMQDAGADETELKAAAVEAGADSQELDRLLEGDEKGKSKMVMPKGNLPDEIRNAENVRVFTHPRWGQMFLPNYPKFEALLDNPDWQSVSYTEALVRKYLEEPQYNWFIWQQLAQQNPAQLEQILQSVLNRPNFQLKTDLEPLLVQEFHKPLEPELPEIASVPVHLHELFQAAVAEVNKTKAKTKGKKKARKGFL